MVIRSASLVQAAVPPLQARRFAEAIGRKGRLAPSSWSVVVQLWRQQRQAIRKLFNQGMILAFSYRDAQGRYYEPSEVAERDGRHYAGSTELNRQVEKMSKSRFNVVKPNDVVAEYGADSMRLYGLFMGPLDVAKPWQMAGLTGVRRFLDRAWRLVYLLHGRTIVREIAVPGRLTNFVLQ